MTNLRYVGRFFLEKLRKGLTFLSPLLHDYNVQQNIWETITSIAPEAQWFHIRDGLASLCLYGLSPKERHRKGAYSFLLEQMELANKIGWILIWCGHIYVLMLLTKL